MEENLIDIYARLSFYEFLLEIQHANLFAAQENSDELLKRFRSDMLELITFQSTVKSDADLKMAETIQQRQIEIVEQFFDRVAERMISISAALQKLQE